MGHAHTGNYANTMLPNPYSVISEYIEKLGIPDFIADACVPGPLVRAMRSEGRKILYIGEIDGTTRTHMPDIEIINLANKLGVKILTLNIKDFVAALDNQIPLTAGSVSKQLEQIARYGYTSKYSS